MPRVSHQRVYLMKSLATGNYKIGVSQDVSHRLKEVSRDLSRIGLASKLYLVHATPLLPSRLAIDLEHSLHKQLRHLNVAGEWFNLSSKDVGHVIAVFEAQGISYAA